MKRNPIVVDGLDEAKATCISPRPPRSLDYARGDKRCAIFKSEV